MIHRRGWLMLAAAAGTTGLLGCDRSKEDTQLLPSRLVKDMKTHAVGRELVDLPADFEMAGGHAVLTYGLTADFTSVEITVLSFSATAASYTAAARELETKAALETHDKLPNTSMLIEKTVLSPTATLLKRFDNSLMTDAFQTELIALVGSVLVTAKQASYQQSPELAKKRLIRLAGQMTAAAGDGGAKGFRLGSLLIADEHDQEDGSVFFRSKTAPGVLVEILVNALSPNPTPSLLGRWEAPDWDASAMGPKPTTVRRGATTLAGMPAEELITKAEINHRLVMKLWAESKRPVAGFATPLMKVQLDTEAHDDTQRATPPWSESDTLAVWDAIVKSTKPRSGAV